MLHGTATELSTTTHESDHDYWKRHAYRLRTHPSTARQVSILTSTATPTSYCNGTDMDSRGYTKTLTHDAIMDLPDPSLSK